MDLIDAQVAPLPTAEAPPQEPLSSDAELLGAIAACLVGFGASLPPEAEKSILATLAQRRAADAGQLESAYLAVSLFAANLVTLVGAMKAASQPHPHGREPRVLVYASEFDAVVKATPTGFVMPPIREAQRLNSDIAELRKARRDADSAKATLRRIAQSLSEALAADGLVRHLSVEEAATGARDLAQTELKAQADLGLACPTESELAACYYPVQPRDASRVKPGDTLYDPEAKQVVYQHGSARETLPPEQGAAAALEQVAKGKAVLLRPFGSQAVLALRVRMGAARLGALAHVEGQLSKKKDGVLHAGRAQGLGMAHELLSGPSWSLPPLVDKDRTEVAKSDESGATQSG